MSIRFLSGNDGILSPGVVEVSEVRRESPAGAAEAQTDGVGRDAEHHGHLARLQTLPRPQSEELAIVGPEGSERGSELVGRRLRVSDRRRRRSLCTDAVDQPETALRTASMVGETLTSDLVRPGQRVIPGNVVKTAPQHGQGVVEDLVRVVGVGAPAEVPLERFVHHIGETLEARFACVRSSHAGWTLRRAVWFPSERAARGRDEHRHRLTEQQHLRQIVDHVSGQSGVE